LGGGQLFVNLTGWGASGQGKREEIIIGFSTKMTKQIQLTCQGARKKERGNWGRERVFDKEQKSKKKRNNKEELKNRKKKWEFKGEVGGVTQRKRGITEGEEKSSRAKS